MSSRGQVLSISFDFIYDRKKTTTALFALIAVLSSLTADLNDFSTSHLSTKLSELLKNLPKFMVVAVKTRRIVKSQVDDDAWINSFKRSITVSYVLQPSLLFQFVYCSWVALLHLSFENNSYIELSKMDD